MTKMYRLVGLFLLVLILLSNCGISGRRNGDDINAFATTFENTMGFYELTFYAVMFEYLFNLDELPFQDIEPDHISKDLALFNKYYERKELFESLYFRIDSVYIEFRAKGQFVASSEIKSINLIEGMPLIDREYAIFSGEIIYQFEYSSTKGSGEVTIDSDSMKFNSHSFPPKSGVENNNVVEFSVNASYKQHDSPSIPADNATMHAFCSIVYSGETAGSEKTKEGILLLHFVKNGDSWKFDSADKNLVEFLENLAND